MLTLASLVDDLFAELGDNGLLDRDSGYFEQARRRVERTCRHIFTLDDLLKDSSEVWGTSRQATMWLFAYTWFLDEALDNLNDRRVRANQIAEHLLLRYSNWVSTTCGAAVFARFLEAHAKYSEYLRAEKKWSAPDEYVKRFGQFEAVISKASICLFPFEYLASAGGGISQVSLSEVYERYFVCLLLADDIQDIDDDIQSRTLTYPIAMHYRETATLPSAATEVIGSLDSIRQELVRTAAAVNEKCLLLKLDTAVFALDRLILSIDHPNAN